MVADDAHMGMEDHAKVGKALKHFFGSEEGEVLVSGTGLGGLAWEIFQLDLFTRRLSALK